MVLLAVLLSVTLADPFGVAEATAVEAGPPLVVEVTVELSGAWEAVLARMVSVGGELEPVALVARGDGSWGATIRLTEREDVRIAFEAISPGSGEPVISTAHPLTDLGVDQAVFSPVTTTTAAELSLPSGAGWLGLAVGAAVLAIAALAVWSSIGRRAPLVDDPPVDGSVDDSPLDDPPLDWRSGNAEHTIDPDHDEPTDDPRRDVR